MTDRNQHFPADNIPYENPNTGPSIVEKILMIFPSPDGLRREVLLDSLEQKKIKVRYTFPDGTLYRTLGAPLNSLALERKECVRKLEAQIQPAYHLFMTAIDPDNQT